MIFHVEWTENAVNQLAAIWSSAKDRQSVNDAVIEIDRVLSQYPTIAGESRQGDNRIFFAPPLCVIFDVEVPDRTTIVSSAGWSGKPC